MPGPSRDELPDVALAAAKEAARQAINETFALLGVNVADFNSMQELRDDLAFVRRTRTSAVRIGARFVLSIVSLASGAIAIGAWEYIKSIFAHAQ